MERVVVASTNDIKNGTVLDLDGQLWQVLWFQHHKPGKGNTVVRTKIRNIVNGKTVDRTFPADTKIDMAQVDRSDMQYLYEDATGFVVMDNNTYEQMTIPAETFGNAKDYLLEGATITVATNEGNPLYIELPASVELEITYTEPGLQGDRSTGGTKPATLETGKQIQVPLFIATGERVKVSTESGEYLGRVNN
nr:elongation factor P [Propionibacterium sp. oral taxon 192]